MDGWMTPDLTYLPKKLSLEFVSSESEESETTILFFGTVGVDASTKRRFSDFGAIMVLVVAAFCKARCWDETVFCSDEQKRGTKKIFTKGR